MGEDGEGAVGDAACHIGDGAGKVIFVIGSTGTGKTKLAIELARRYGGEIINADAMQLYRGLDVATNKATREEQCGVPHHLLGVLDTHERWTVIEFQRAAQRCIAEVAARGAVPIVVGGTLYYVTSLLFPSLVGTHAADQSHNDGNDDGDDGAEGDPQQLWERLRAVDPERAERLHARDVRKVRRSLQVFEQTGRKHSAILAEQARADADAGGKAARMLYPGSVVLWLDCALDVLDARLDARVDTMLERGLLDEARTMHAALQPTPGHCEHGVFQSIGFKEFLPLLTTDAASAAPADASTRDACVSRFKAVTRRYARKQLRWVRKRLLPHALPLYRLDTSVPAQWARDVLARACIVVDAMTQGTACPVAPERVHVPAHTAAPEWHKRTCDVCQRTLNGPTEWTAHVRSRAHRTKQRKRKRQQTQRPK